MCVVGDLVQDEGEGAGGHCYYEPAIYANVRVLGRGEEVGRG